MQDSYTGSMRSLLLLTLLCSCAHFQSGHHILVKKGESIDVLAKRFNLAKSELLSSNEGGVPRVGEAYFIPSGVGLIHWGGESQEKTKESLESKEFGWPVPSKKRVSSLFGKRWGRAHEGIDIPGPVGTQIVASRGGKATFVGRMGGYGNIVIISHNDGYFSVYAHLSKFQVNQGAIIKRGQKIGKMGKTGRVTGSHLHFEIRYNSKALDPKPFLSHYL